MIDRKTKDIDASVELLKDRKEQVKPILLFFGVATIVIFLMAVILEYYDAGAGVCGYTVAIIFFTGYVCVALLYCNYSIFIQFRRIMETQRDHTILIDDVLINLEKLNKKNIIKKVKK